jgi:hypothetical protein
MPRATAGSTHHNPSMVLAPDRSGHRRRGRRRADSAFAGGCLRAELASEAALHPAEDGHRDGAAGGQRDADSAGTGVVAGSQREDGVDRDVGGEKEERR